MNELSKVLKIPARFVDVVHQRSVVNSIVMKDGVIKDISSGEIEGIGVRVLENTWGFSSANSEKDVLKMAKGAYHAAKSGKKIEFLEADGITDDVSVKPKIDPLTVGIEEKGDILRRAFDATKEFKEVVSSTFSYSDIKSSYRYLSSEGTIINSEYVRVGFFASVFAKKDGKFQIGLERSGATGGLESLKDSSELSKEASERALRLLDAGQAPSGTFTVVIDPLLTGVFIHEALGHCVEGDHIIQNESVLEDKLNESIASELVNVYDDPTLEGSFGFYFYDSEGTKARKKAILKNGVLKEYLHSRETASRMNMEPNGNARAQSFNYSPVVRMSNTYLAPGDFKFEEMLEGIKNGIYLKGSKGGEVDTARGVFQFSAEEGFLIENGELTRPVRDVSLSGETLKILKNIDAVGSKFKTNIGFCGKASQTVPVGDGGPHIRTLATVGGQNGA